MNDDYISFLLPSQEEFVHYKQRAISNIDSCFCYKVPSIEPTVVDFITYLNKFSDITPYSFYYDHVYKDLNIELCLTAKGFKDFCEVYKMLTNNLDVLTPREFNFSLKFNKTSLPHGKFIKIATLSVYIRNKTHNENVLNAFKAVMNTVIPPL